jgi:hypothetical protein
MFRIIASTCLLRLLVSPTVVFGQADVIFVGGNVLTADSRRLAVEAVALARERIRAVGSNKEIQRLAGAKTRVIDLRGRTVIPGLMDAHVHLPSSAESETSRHSPSGAIRVYQRWNEYVSQLISRKESCLKDADRATRNDPSKPYLHHRERHRECRGAKLRCTGSSLVARRAHTSSTNLPANP